MYQRYGNNSMPNIKPDHFVGKFYVMYQQKAAKNPNLEDEILTMLQKWEDKDKDIRRLWKKLDTWTTKGFKQTYKTFGSKFDITFKESDFYNKAQPIIKQAIKKNIFKKDKDNSIYIDLEKYNLSKKTIQRADSTSIYITNDLALTKYKFEHFKIKKSIWVVGSEQDLYFQQLFKILELLKFKWAKDCKHLSYNLVYLPEGKMKSREGNVVDADNIIEQMKDLAKQEIIRRHKLSKKELDKRSQMVGLAALKFYLLKYDLTRNIHFNPQESISFEGDTGPYIQYTYARICSILKKTKFKISNLENLDTQEEYNLINKLSNFPLIIEKSAKEYKPSLIANYLLELAHSTNEYYHKYPVLKSSPSTKQSRLQLIDAIKIVLQNGLSLLGIDSPKIM